MKRREFSAAVVGVGALGMGAWAMRAAQAQGMPAEEAYKRLAQRVPVSVPAGKIEVVEFFSYACPHCHEFDPSVQAWAAKLPADVVFRHVPVAFRPNWVGLQRLYFTLEAMGLLGALHGKAFEAFHRQRVALEQPDVAADWAVKNGVDGAKFKAVYNSFGMSGKLAQANRLAEMFKIEGVPTLGIQGQYLTSVSMTHSVPKTFEVANALIAAVRAGR